MGSASDDLMQLRPVTFTYKSDASQRRKFGLIAEEVAQVFPYLVATGTDGQPESVKYHEIAAILLNEVQKLRKELNALKS